MSKILKKQKNQVNNHDIVNQENYKALKISHLQESYVSLYFQKAIYCPSLKQQNLITRLVISLQGSDLFEGLVTFKQYPSFLFSNMANLHYPNISSKKQENLQFQTLCPSQDNFKAGFSPIIKNKTEQQYDSKTKTTDETWKQSHISVNMFYLTFQSMICIEAKDNRLQGQNQLKEYSSRCEKICNIIEDAQKQFSVQNRIQYWINKVHNRIKKEINQNQCSKREQSLKTEGQKNMFSTKMEE